MLDSAGTGPDFSLFLGPDDTADFVGACHWRDRAGRVRPVLLYVLLHRRGAETWTHACRVPPDRRTGHLTLHLERALPGDRRAELAAWLRAAAEAMRRD
ncbi:hypothetical protein [Falsiroseomonas tokyonensis]|uniref:Uncharacterized protein n=1 Tax=Falsiroseomonas tokyonensis TaxID=430521 RepID=A0ABV7BLU5_9PROT|nr:hypothetical protein [Falsiroseomonas tokyonensis]MBU8536546.1 hypothetical protein [Falsiroseomonas tokyonensis]